MKDSQFSMWGARGGMALILMPPFLAFNSALASSVEGGAHEPVPAIAWSGPAPKPISAGYRLIPDYTRDGQSDVVFALEQAVVNVASVDGKPVTSSFTHVVDYLFLNPKTGDTRWLFPTHHQIISQTILLTDKSQGSASSVVIYEVLHASKEFRFCTGTNSCLPEVDVFAIKPDSPGLTKLVDDANYPPFIELRGREIAVWYTSHGHPADAFFSLTDLKPIKHHGVTSAPPK